MLNFSIKKSEKKLENIKIVCIGGGTGLFSLLSGLKDLVPNRRVIKAIVAMTDNGGSSGKLITQYGVLPPGDIRNCLVALCEESKTVSRLFQYRFDENLEKHNFGNLFLTALNDITGSFDSAVKEASRILRVKGEVIPISLEKNNLIADFADGSTVIGESQITKKKNKIKSIYLEKPGIINDRASDVIKDADLIIFGPGSLYTSIIPNILYSDLKIAINSNKKAKKVLITSIMSEPGETDDFCVSDFKCEIEKYLEGNISHIIVNNHIPASLALKEYQKENKYPILLDEKKISDCKIIKGNYIDESKLVRHNPKKLAKAIIDLI